MAGRIGDSLTVKMDNLSTPNMDPKRGRGRPRKDDKKPHTSTTGQKSYPCDWPHCGMWFSQSSNLNKHYLTHTNEKPFKCLWPNCNKSFKQSSNLNKHRFVHTGEKPFSCDYPQCNKRFSQSSNLKKHKMVHSGEKPYHCQYPGCTKVFDQSSNLNKHFLTHMGQKPYRCTVCDESFSQSSNLAKHMRKHSQYSFKTNNRENSINEETGGDSRLLPNSLQSNCYQANGTTTNNGNVTSNNNNNNSNNNNNNNNNNNLPTDLHKLDPCATAAMTAAANAFFTNHHRNRINTFDLDQKFISGAHNFLNPVSVGLASPFTQPATTSSSRHLSRSHSIDHFTNDNLENGIDIPRSPADPNRFLSMKLSVNSSDD